MRIFHLFLILNVVVCVGGLCNSPITFAASTNEATESCHKMDKHETPVTETLDIMQDFNQQADFNSSCCNEYLTNSSSDQYVKVIYTNVTRSWVQNILTTQDNKINNRSQREHGPPNIQVLHSTFLI